MRATYWLAIVAGFAFVMAGCPPVYGDDDDTSADDDDTADDDTADDDDTGDDDDTEGMGMDGTYYSISFLVLGGAKNQPEPFWFAYSFEIDVTGGWYGGPGTVQPTITSYEGDEYGLGDEICSQTLEYPAQYSYGTSQGNDYWEYIDEIIDWSGTSTEIDNGCWWDPLDMYGEEWSTAMAWLFNPLGFVSCDRVNVDPTLAAMPVGPDPFQLVAGDQDFDGMCNQVGPQLEAQLGTGPMEGLWYIPMPDGWLASFGNYAYYAPPDTTNVESWGFFGYLMNDAANP